MANNFHKIKNGLNLQPSAAPSSPQDGDVWHDNTNGLMVRTNGSSQQAGAPAAAQSSPSGAIIMYAGATEPTGWVFCYGQAVSRSAFSALFTAIGTIYGVGDGSTTFNLPDLRGRVAVGRDDMGGTAATRITAAIAGITGTTLGATGGNQAMHGHTHTASGLTVSGSNTSSSISGSADFGGSHTHTIRLNANSGVTPFNSAYPNPGTDNNALSTGTPPGTPEGAHSHSLSGTANAQSWSGSVGGSTSLVGAGASQNIQPTIIINYIIKT